MSYPEDTWVMLSAIQHYLYCPRQCALIHVEQLWEENPFTAKGRVMHRKTEEESLESHGDDARVERGVALRSERLGITGKADVVEFHRNEEGVWEPFPVEYKLGKPKENRCDEAQLCAQALCLEEMLGTSIPNGALFYGRTRRRKDVAFDEELRRITIDTAARIHEMIESGETPKAVYVSKRCRSCSMLGVCLPKAAAKSLIHHYELDIEP